VEATDRDPLDVLVILEELTGTADARVFGK
jgi:hypothetical protein